MCGKESTVGMVEREVGKAVENAKDVVGK